MPDEFEATLAADRAGYQKQIDQEIIDQRAQNERAKAAAEAARQQREPEWDALKKRQAEFEATPPPTLEKPPTAPKTQEMLQPTSLQKTFGMASIFALLSVGLAKGNAIYGLKALGGFMEGAHAGNVDQAKAAHQDFVDKMDEVHATNENALKEYNAIIGNKKFSLEAQEHMYRMKALEYNDELGLQAQTQGGMNAVTALNKQRADVDFRMLGELDRRRRVIEQERHDRAMESRTTSGSGARPSKEEYELMLSARARGQTTGNQLVDNLSPEDAAARLKKGGATSTQERQELTALLTSYQKEATAIQKKMDSYHLFSPPKELSEQLKDIKAKMLQVRSRLSEMSGLQGGALPPAGGTAKSKEERLKALGF